MTMLEERPTGAETPKPKCSDCGATVRWQGSAAIERGSSVREPGEALCGSCSSARVQLVRQLDRVPDTIAGIRVTSRWVR